jgi:hypothetical protein
MPFLLIHREKAEARTSGRGGRRRRASQSEPKSAEPNAGEPKPEAGAGAGAGGETGEPCRQARAVVAPRAVDRRPIPPSRSVPKAPTSSCDLTSGQERTIHDVVAYGLSGKGKWLWYHSSAKQPVEGRRYGLFVQPLAGGDAVQLLDGIAHVGNVTVTRGENAIAFTSDRVDFQADKPQDDLYLWDGGPSRRAASPCRRCGHGPGQGHRRQRVVLPRRLDAVVRGARPAREGTASDPARGQGLARHPGTGAMPVANRAAEARQF